MRQQLLAITIIVLASALCPATGRDCNDKPKRSAKGLLFDTECYGNHLQLQFSQCSEFWNNTVELGDIVGIYDGSHNKNCCGGVLIHVGPILTYKIELYYNKSCCNADVVTVDLPNDRSIQVVELNLAAYDIATKPKYSPVYFSVRCTYAHSTNASGNGTVINGGGNNPGNNTGWVNGTGAAILTLNTPTNFANGEGDTPVSVNIGDMLELQINLNNSQDTYSSILPYFCAFSASKSVTDNPISFIQYGCPDSTIKSSMPGIFQSWNSSANFTDYTMEFIAFEFEKTDSQASSQLYVHCVINLCITGADGTTDCNATQQCQNDKGDQWNVASSYSDSESLMTADQYYQQLLLENGLLGKGGAKNRRVVKSASVPIITNPTSNSKVWYIVIGVVGGLLVVSLISIGLLLAFRGPLRTKYLEKQIQGDTRWVFPFHIPRARLDPSTIAPSSQGSIISNGRSSRGGHRGEYDYGQF